MGEATTPMTRAQSGVEGLDEVLLGGFIRNRFYLLEGKPGTGKTTIATQVLMAAARRGERALYITLSETREELLDTMRSHGWSLPEGFDIVELLPAETLLDEGQQQSLLYSADLELDEATKKIFAEIDRVRPTILVLDSLSEIRLLAQSSLRYRRKILSLKHYFARHDVTVLALDDLTVDVDDQTVHSIAHGVIALEEMVPIYGAERRRLRVVKYRSTVYRGGFHDFAIRTGGVVVFPRLRAMEHKTTFEKRVASSGNAELDKLAGGGFERGTTALILGPAGTGKSNLSMSFAAAAVARGEHVALFVFDEEVRLLKERAAGLGVDLERLFATGLLSIEQIDPAEISPGEFAARVRRHVERDSLTMVVIDSLNGYQAAMPEEHFLLLHMHELVQYLNRRGVSTFINMAQHGLVGDMKSPVDVTYLADTVILLRFFEAAGAVRRAISILKKRGGPHENTIREYTFGPNGIRLSAALSGFQGILRGVPQFIDGRERPGQADE